MTEVINRGSAPLDPAAESVYDAFGKVNNNFVSTDQWPVVDLDKRGVSPGNQPQTNVDAINNTIASIKAAGIQGVHLKLNRAGTYQVTQGSSPEHAQRYACIMLPSNCKFELSPATILQLAKPDGSQSQQSYLFRNDDPIDGNKNIEICGGIFDGNWPRDSAGSADIIVPGQQGYYGLTNWWENIQGMYEHDTQYINPARWCSAQTKLRRANFERMFFNDCYRDGYHFCGECYDIIVRDIRGRCEDNMIPILTNENEFQGQSNGYFQGQYNWADGSSVAGNMERILVENCTFDECVAPVAIAGKSGLHIHDLTIRNMSGTVNSLYAIGTHHYTLLGSAPEIRRLTIENVKVRTRTTVGSSDSVVKLAQPSGTKDVTLRNIESINGYAVALNGTSFDSIRMDNIVNLGQSDRGVIIMAPDYPVHAKNIQIGRIHCSPKVPSVQWGIITGTNDRWDSFSIADYRHHQNDDKGKPLYIRNGGTVHIGKAHFTTRPGGTDSQCFTGTTGAKVYVNDLVYDNHYQLANNFVKVRADNVEILDKGSLQQGPFTTNVASDNTLLTSTAHGLVLNQKVQFVSGTTLPAPLTANTDYFVRNPTANAFQVALTTGGPAVVMTDDGTGYHTWTAEGLSTISSVIDSQASFSTPGQWWQLRMDHDDPLINVAEVNATAGTLTMPPGSVVTEVIVRHYQSWRGGGSTACTIEARLRDPDTLLGVAEDVFAGTPAPTVPFNRQSIANLGGPTNVIGQVDIIVRATGANLADFTTGQAVAFVKFETQGVQN